jgi:quercetin dioxygenase-like cupin family protein
MRRYIGALGILLAVLVGRPAAAQTPAAGDADPGVRPTRLIDRAEVRVSRIEIQPGATRRVHTHDDVEYHLWIPIEGHLQLTIGSDAPIAAASGQAFFFKRGTPHGFKNIGTTPAAVFEIFVKQTAVAGPEPSGNPLGALALEMAAVREADRLR